MPDKEPIKNIWSEPLRVFGKISGWVVTPIILSLFIGKFFDTKFGTTPWIFLGLTAFAFLISCFGIYRESMLYMKQIETTHGNKTPDNTNND